MVTHKPKKNISIIGTHLFQPIVDLVAHLLARPYDRPDRVSSNYYECGYSAAAILLLVAFIESFVQRDRYFFQKDNPSATPSSNVIEYLKNPLKYRRHAQLKELFNVRNSVAHNHIWETEFTIPKKGGRRHKNSAIVPGTHRLAAVPHRNTKIPRTRLLKLHLKPDHLDRTDLQKALSAVLHLHDFLLQKGHNPINVVQETFLFRRGRVVFRDLAQLVKGTLTSA